MKRQARAGTPDYPIWGIPTAEGWWLYPQDITAATGIEVPIDAIVEWRDRGSERGLGYAFDVRVFVDLGPVLIDWVAVEARQEMGR